ncbi:hypothetical protein DZA50_05490 [Kangiella sp. HD9-110m-PIT-SAG07]|nr:hypothetical protein DZA50_05490 [Kangiella sp. HD9-110m-PIT-SAG07]
MDENRTKMKAQYTTLYSEVEQILFRLDPVGINFGENTDEYASEVDTILPRLKEASSQADVLNIVHEEFCRWFDVDTAGKKSQPVYSEVASEIWKSWLKFSRLIHHQKTS